MRYSDITENNDDMFAGPSMVKLLAKAIAHDYADDDFDFYSLRDRYKQLSNNRQIQKCERRLTMSWIVEAKRRIQNMNRSRRRKPTKRRSKR